MSAADGAWVSDASSWLSFHETTARLVALARDNGGHLTATQVEADEELAADRGTTSAAACALAALTNVVGARRGDGWFPYQELRFSELP
jgi:hypothetical protein